MRYEIEIVGELYKEGSSVSWVTGISTAIVAADSRAEATIEVFEGLGNHGHIEEEGGDAEWAAFEGELVIRVRPIDEDEEG